MATSTPLRRIRLLALGLVALLGATLLVAPAHAHDVLIGSEPSQGEVVSEPPGHITLTFNNPPLDVGSAIVVVDGDDETVAEGEGTVEGTDVRLELDPPLGGGEYEVRWRVASSDGHPIEGTIPFAVDSPDPTPEPTVGQEPTTAAAAATPAAPQTAPELVTNDAAASSPDNSSTGLAGLPTWLKIAVALAALGSVAGLIVLTARRLRQR